MDACHTTSGPASEENPGNTRPSSPSRRSVSRLLPVLGALTAIAVGACSDLGPPSAPDRSPGTAPESGPPALSGADDPVVPGRILAAFTPGADRSSIAQSRGATLQREIGLGIWTLEVPTGAEEAVSEALGRAPGVRFAEPDRIRTFPAFSCETCVLTGDPFTGFKWDLRNTGEIRSSSDDLVAVTGQAGADLNWLPMFQALDEAEHSAAVRVAILDSGVRSTHEDLAGRVVGGWNFFHGNSNHADDHGHGTHVAGIIAAHATNGTGLSGVAHFSGVELLSVKVCGPTLVWFGLVLQYGCTDSAITEGIIWAADNGARVLNLSLGGSTHSQSQQNALAYALEQGGLPVCAAGNDGTSVVSYPGRNPECVAVSSTNWSDGLASYSNFGAEIEVAAPGGDFEHADGYSQIPSTLNGDDASYGFMAGTSMAAPQVTGLAAVLASLGVEGPAAVRERLLATADDLGDSGWDPVYGWGRINAAAAIDGLVEAPEDPPPANEPPSVEITSPEDGASFEAGDAAVSLTATAFDPEDGDLTSAVAWTSSEDGSLGSGGSLSTTELSVGEHTITASVTDSGGLTGSDEVTITVTEPASEDPEDPEEPEDPTDPEPETMSVTLSATTRRSGPNWEAFVTIAAQDDLGNAVAGASVSGTWSAAGSEATLSCETGSDGTCTVQSGLLRRSGRDAVPETTFTVEEATHPDLDHDGGNPSVTVSAP